MWSKTYVTNGAVEPERLRQMHRRDGHAGHTCHSLNNDNKNAFAEPLFCAFSFPDSAMTKCLFKHNLPQSPNSTRTHRKEHRAGQHVDSHCFLLSYSFVGKAA